MPTGYTSPLYEGRAITFQEFVLRCARGMGALIELRDESIDAPIPENLSGSDGGFHAAAIKKARAESKRIEAMDEDEIAKLCDAAFRERLAEWERSRIERRALKKRYESMLEKVQAWTPPTKDHEGLKAFMVDQLTDSLRFDCSDSSELAPKAITPRAWREERLAELARDIAYHEQAAEEEAQRSKERNAWLKTLRESLTEATP